MRQKIDNHTAMRDGDTADAAAYAAMQAQIAALTKEVHQLRGQHQESARHPPTRSPALASQSRTPDQRPGSAASELQRRHERGSATATTCSSSDAADEHGHLAFESFPSLSCSDAVDSCSQRGTTATYAKVLRDSISQSSSKRPAQHDEHLEGDSKWVMLTGDGIDDIDLIWSADSQPTSTRHLAMTTSQTALKNIIKSASKSNSASHKAHVVEAPKLATERRIAERRKRMSLPPDWMLPTESNPDTIANDDATFPRTSLRKTYAQVSSMSTSTCNQPPRYSVGSLKSSPSKCTLSRATASKAPNYASPTTASKHRASPGDISRSSSPQKTKSVRMDNAAFPFTKPSDQSSSSDRRVATPLCGSAISKSRSLNDKHKIGKLASSMDGAADSHESDVPQPGRTNGVRGQSRKGKLDLSITIPDRSVDLPSLSSPSRIPLPVHTAGQNVCQGDHKQISNIEEKEAVTPVVQSLDQDKRTQRSIDRASILEPIKRRRSAASTRSRSNSGASITQPGQTWVAGRVQEETDLDGETLRGHVSEEETHIAEPGAVDSPANESLSAHFRVPPFTQPFEVIRQTHDNTAGGHSTNSQHCRHTDKVLDFRKELKATSRSAKSTTRPHSNSDPTNSVPEISSAIVICGSVEIKPSTPASTIPGVQVGRPQPSNLRATAPSFVPIPPASDVFVPAFKPSVVVPTSKPRVFVPAANLDSNSDVCMPRTHLKSRPGNVPSQTLPPHNDIVPDSVMESPPKEDLSGLSAAHRAQLAQKGRERGSSSASSSTTLNSTGDSSSSRVSPKRFAGSGSEQGRPYWDWVGSSHSASTSPIRFGRGPLPSMPENGDESIECGSVERDVVRRKGWKIGSAAPGWWYGWKGGDGLEISFKGHGPHAEINPDAPVNFQDHDRGSVERDVVMPGRSPRHGPARGKRGGRTNSFSSVERWARAVGYPAVPCGNFEVKTAAEHMGIPMNNHVVNGWCHDCWPQQGGGGF